MAQKITTTTTCTCDLCGAECDVKDGEIEIQVNSGDGRDAGPGFIRGRMAVCLPYQTADGDICKPCLLKWLGTYARNQGMA